MTGLPEVGALVEVTATGTVQRHGVDGTGFMITVEGGRAWIPACATVKVLAPPRPPEVLLLDCGHLTDTETLQTSTTGGDSGAWCPRCDRWKHSQAVGSVSW